VFNGVHAIIYTREVEAMRAFFRDTLGFTAVDAGGGWLIFGLPPAEVAMHPGDGPTSHELFLLCEDIHATMAALRDRGVEFTREVSEERWGLVTAMRLPDGGELSIYQPLHPTAIAG
jgi:catechol 2,3-dioxygenase-like lactoylglutathione lyase family enzyme